MSLDIELIQDTHTFDSLNIHRIETRSMRILTTQRHQNILPAQAAVASSSSNQGCTHQKQKSSDSDDDEDTFDFPASLYDKINTLFDEEGLYITVYSPVVTSCRRLKPAIKIEKTYNSSIDARDSLLHYCKSQKRGTLETAVPRFLARRLTQMNDK